MSSADQSNPSPHRTQSDGAAHPAASLPANPTELQFLTHALKMKSVLPDATLDLVVCALKNAATGKQHAEKPLMATLRGKRPEVGEDVLGVLAACTAEYLVSIDWGISTPPTIRVALHPPPSEKTMLDAICRNNFRSSADRPLATWLAVALRQRDDALRTAMYCWMLVTTRFADTVSFPMDGMTLAEFTISPRAWKMIDVFVRLASVPVLKRYLPRESHTELTRKVNWMLANRTAAVGFVTGSDLMGFVGLHSVYLDVENAVPAFLLGAAKKDAALAAKDAALAAKDAALAAKDAKKDAEIQLLRARLRAFGVEDCHEELVVPLCPAKEHSHGLHDPDATPITPPTAANPTQDSIDLCVTATAGHELTHLLLRLALNDANAHTPFQAKVIHAVHDPAVVPESGNEAEIRFFGHVFYPPDRESGYRGVDAVIRNILALDVEDASGFTCERVWEGATKIGLHQKKATSAAGCKCCPPRIYYKK
jgi:hypothetical protein